MKSDKALSADVLKLDFDKETEKITTVIRQTLKDPFHKQGVVIGVSGGIDSSTVAALCTLAVGKDRVFALQMPERDSSEETVSISGELCDYLKIPNAVEEITPILEALGCYHRRNKAVQEVIPEFTAGWKCKIVLPGVTENRKLRIFSIIALSPEGKEIRARLTPNSYLGIVAATNFKQRTRKMLEYYQADRLKYAVAGTPNRLEYDQGFFVKGGDGLADLKPIAHLYKTQVYALARHLGLPETICSRPPTTDTYSMPQSQEEFYFSLPYDKMDLCLYGHNHGFKPARVAPAVGLTAEQVRWIYEDIEQKRRSTRYLHAKPALMEPVPEIEIK